MFTAVGMSLITEGDNDDMIKPKKTPYLFDNMKCRLKRNIDHTNLYIKLLSYEINSDNAFDIVKKMKMFYFII